ncbi:MAG: hypothetical protein ABWZ55_10910, partial [Acidimicrobiales bacterium]
AFTLRELARRALDAGPRPPEVEVADWLAMLVEQRTTAEHLGESSSDDVADPYGRNLRSYRKCADELDGLIGVVADQLWPAAEPRADNALRSTTA